MPSHKREGSDTTENKKRNILTTSIHSASEEILRRQMEAIRAHHGDKTEWQKPVTD